MGEIKRSAVVVPHRHAKIAIRDPDPGESGNGLPPVLLKIFLMERVLSRIGSFLLLSGRLL